MTIGDAHGLVGIVSVDHKCGRLMSLILGMRLGIVRVCSWSARIVRVHSWSTQIMRVYSWSVQDRERRLALLKLICFASERTPLHLDLFPCFAEHVYDKDKF